MEETEQIEEVEEVVEEPKKLDRNELNIQHFMNDMQLVGNQVRSGQLVKPTFNYGDLSVTNYLLWLLLAELMILNDKMK